MKNLLQWINKVGINNIIWATDLDLTVLDAHKDASKVSSPVGFEDSCRAIDKATEDRFFIITGREMSYVNKIFPNTKFKVSTEYHNVVRWDAGMPPQELSPLPQWNLIDDKINRIISKYWSKDFTMRIKPFMRSIHYSHAPALKDEFVKAQVKQDLQNVLDEYAQMTGHKLTNIDGGSVFDIAPEGSSKAKAYQDILGMMANKFPARKLVPIYFGDSSGDLDAVPIVKAAGGVFVSVGDDPNVMAQADFHLKDTAMCRDLFDAAHQLKPKITLPTPKDPTPDLP